MSVFVCCRTWYRQVKTRRRGVSFSLARQAGTGGAWLTLTLADFLPRRRVVRAAGGVRVGRLRGGVRIPKIAGAGGQGGYPQARCVCGEDISCSAGAKPKADGGREVVVVFRVVAHGIGKSKPAGGVIFLVRRDGRLATLTLADFLPAGQGAGLAPAGRCANPKDCGVKDKARRAVFSAGRGGRLAGNPKDCGLGGSPCRG